MPSARIPDPAPAGSLIRSAHVHSPAEAGLRTGQTGPPGDPAPAYPSARVPAPAVAFGGLRLVEVPSGWPPYDCAVHGAGCPSARVASRPGLCTEPDLCAEPDLDAPGCSEPPGAASRDAEPAGPSPACSAGPPARGADPAVAWSRQLAQAITEVMSGSRSPRQLAPWTTERVRDRITLLTQTLAPGQRPRIRRIVTSRPAARVVEMTVVLSCGPRSRALALRLEQLPGRRAAPGLPGRPARWLCTEIEIG
jgi:hypothetical protein